MERESFVFYKSYYDAITKLPLEQQAEAYNAIIQYAIFHKAPDNMTPTAELCLTFAKPTLEANYRRYVNGTQPKKRGNTVAYHQQTESEQAVKSETSANPVSEPEANGSKVEANGSKPEGNVNVTVTGNDNVTDTEMKKPVKVKEKHTHGTYGHVRLTEEEYLQLQKEYSNAEEIIQFLDNYIEEKGYKAKNHYLTIKRWVADAVDEQKWKAGSRGHRDELPDYMKQNYVTPKEGDIVKPSQKEMDEINELLHGMGSPKGGQND